MTDRAPAPWFHVAFGAAYPVVYAHRDQQEAARALDLASRLLGESPGPWLDLGCGQGRHLADLGRRGHTVIGVDLSAPLLALARRDGVDEPLVRADMRALPLATGAFGAVLSLFTAFGYFGDARAHGPMLAEVARVLAPGGGWLLDFLDSERVAAELAGGTKRRQRRSGPLDVREERDLATEPRRVIKRVELQAAAGQAEAAAALGVGAAGLAYQEQVTLFSLAELDDLAGGVGLERVAAAGGYDGRPLQPGSSERWLLLYRKPLARKDPT